MSLSAPRESPHPITQRAFLYLEADGPPRLLRRRHELSDGLEKRPDTLIVALDLPFQVRQVRCQLRMPGSAKM